MKVKLWQLIVLGLGALLPTAAQQQLTAAEKRWNRLMERLQQALELTPQQQEQLRNLFHEYRERRPRERQAFREKLASILTPEQREKLQRLIKEHRQQRRQRLQER
ncbi:MAG: hypothetical protein NZ960_00835 [Candidatus Kapabacteria bacterium]|nr:hypothetical protein [Candidatus Kapabacteria bacterium]MDW8011572.1 hypothetical protein [Bacteroidota bacterium]